MLRTISKDDLGRFRCIALLVDHSAIDFKSVFKAEQIVKASNGIRVREWNEGALERTARVDEKRGKGLYMRTCFVKFVRNKQINERAGLERPHNLSLTKRNQDIEEGTVGACVRRDAEAQQKSGECT
ncbi:hypothetical protein G5I_13231 [Acromyrmex echinatior]|uniref:Uncharacterized protein n=1 Tax=Acromyrmex echinatior TaxID=103372 RepID=F4X4H0_ACREC|nr:hypothetical protein G5I_13231 [Acromyrmex echinatior]